MKKNNQEMIALICDLENALYVREDQIEKLTEKLSSYVKEHNPNIISSSTQQR